MLMNLCRRDRCVILVDATLTNMWRRESAEYAVLSSKLADSQHSDSLDTALQKLEEVKLNDTFKG